MKKTNLRYYISSHFSENKLTYIIVIILFITAVCFGTYTSGTLDNYKYEKLREYIQSFIDLAKNNPEVDNNKIFLISFLNNIKLVLLMWIFSMTFLGIFVAVLIVTFKGFSIGFTSGFIINCLTLKGISFTFFTILPKNIIEIPAYIILTVICINYTITMFGKKNKRRIKNKDSSISEHFFKITLIILVLSISSLIEAYFSPIFLDLFVK